MKHTLNIEDFKGYEFTRQIASSFGRGASKRLMLIVKDSVVAYQLISHGEVVLDTNDITKAVVEYNNI